MPSLLVDAFGRPVTYLRISVTDRCNLRCVYCMPPEGITWQSHDSILTYEEIAAAAREAAQYGVTHIRLTGGEPLVRKGLPDLVRLIANIPGIEDISLTTNGLLLESQAAALAQAGLKRVNISLDTMEAEKFSGITRGGKLEQVWRGILKAEELNLKPLKINMVVMRGLNDGELADFAELTRARDWVVRFIELMPVKNQQAWGRDLPEPGEAYFSISEMLRRLEPLGLQPAGAAVGCGPAQEFRLADGVGKIGFISPIGERFCAACNRLRLTADGHLRPCLLSDAEVDIRAAVRQGLPLLPLFQQALMLKPQGHELDKRVTPTGRCMMQIGG